MRYDYSKNGETRTPHSSIEILLVEDNPADSDVFQRAIGREYHVSTAVTGAEALDRLFQRGRFQNSPKPDIVVLDLNLPLLTGIEVLNAIKANSSTSAMPVVVLSVSDQPRDIQKAFDLGACAYLVKSTDLQDTEEVLSSFAEFWKHVAFPGYMRTPSPPPHAVAVS